MKNSEDRSKKNPMEQRSSIPNDLPDKPADQDKLQGEETVMNIPEVKDIAGQEHIHVPRLREFEDTTISSSDEEGEGLLDNLNGGEDENIRKGTQADVTREELETLRRGDSFTLTRDEARLYNASLDNTDFDGERLNENGFGQTFSGNDLDIPGSEADDRDEHAGEEDEENNSYSLGSDDNSANEERTG